MALAEKTAVAASTKKWVFISGINADGLMINAATPLLINKLCFYSKAQRWYHNTLALYTT